MVSDDELKKDINKAHSKIYDALFILSRVIAEIDKRKVKL